MPVTLLTLVILLKYDIMILTPMQGHLMTVQIHIEHSGSCFSIYTLASYVTKYVRIFIIVKPKITGASPEQTVISDYATVFRCNATSKPLADITWLRGGSVLNRTRIKITFSTDGKDCNDDNPNNLCTSYSVLQLFETQPADSGRYVCNASNDYYSDSHTLYLIVQGNKAMRS